MASIVQDLGESRSSCGYCKSSKGAASQEEKFLSHGVWAHRLSPADYQSLLDIGWRRSGQYLYRPIESCCSLHTIRLDVFRNRLTSSQRSVVRKVERFCKGEWTKSEQKSERSESEDVSAADETRTTLEMPEIQRLANEAFTRILGEEPPVAVQIQKGKKEGLRYSCSTALGIANKKSSAEDEIRFSAMELATAVSDILNSELSTRSGLIVDVCAPGYLNFRRRDAGGSVAPTTGETKRASSARDTAGVAGEKSSRATGVEKKLTTELVAPVCDDETLALYAKYQKTVHGSTEEECGVEEFSGFLVKSPIQTETGSTLGSFHMQYRLDGKLIAVGVIDVLPLCVSAVYFFYDPSLSFLSLGQFSAAREIDLVRSLNLKLPDLHYYYMGYYVESCPKMRYKKQFKPSELLCRETLTWVFVDSVPIATLLRSDYARLASQEIPSVDLAAEYLQTKILTDEGYFVLNSIQRSSRFKSLSEKVKKYASHVGSLCTSMMMYLSEDEDD